MLIRVVYLDGRFDFVNCTQLTTLIEIEGISKFRRSDGWVRVPSDNLRKTGNRNGYNGPERRRHRTGLDSLAWPGIVI